MKLVFNKFVKNLKLTVKKYNDMNKFKVSLKYLKNTFQFISYLYLLLINY